jgi:hypothetical protein
MVIASIVRDNHHPSWPSSADTMEGFEKNKEGGAVELVRLSEKEELAVAKPNRAKVVHAAASWMMEQDGILCLWRNPHLAA